ncbi:MAG: Cu2+-exporting ATPase [Lentimonas sp.]|jgi:Cu2+-exporting ATPase
MLKSESKHQSCTCAHCGTAFTPRLTERYCCLGCDYVAQVLADHDLSRFYELKGDKVLPPVGSKVFQRSDFAALESLCFEAEASSAASAPTAHARLSIEGISCIGCVWLIEAIFMRQAGAIRAQIDPQAGALEIKWQTGNFDLSQFSEDLQQIGYRIHPYNASLAHPRGTKEIHQRLGLCGFFLLNTMLFTLPTYLGMRADFHLAPLFQLIAALFASLSFLVGGGYFIGRALRAIQHRVLHIDLPIATGLIAAYLGSLIGWSTGHRELIYFDFVATFVFLMLAGRWLQEYALEKNRGQLQRQKFGPSEVTALGGSNDGAQIAADAVEAGLVYSIAPGAINPVAADPLDATGLLSLEWINGEADPVVWKKERIAPAGAINVGLQPLRFCARESWAESLLAKLLERPSDSFQNQRLQSILKWYIGTILAIAAIGGYAWLITTGDPLKALQVLISILIVSCPCALGVALPLCDELATARLRTAGLFIKSAEVWARVRLVRTIVFDKTGTLTMETPRLQNPATIRNLDPASVLALYQLVQNNLHPVARALREALLAKQGKVINRAPPPSNANPIQESIGQGVSWADTNGNEWTLGKPEWKAQTAATACQAALRLNGLLVAAFEFSDDVRDDARAAFDRFREQGLNTVILSGDATPRVAQIAEQIGLSDPHFHAECTPEDKANWIRYNAPQHALMIGDGANDSLAFDQAICRGTPVVDRSILQASADFFFFGRSLRCLPELFQTAQLRQQTNTVIFALTLIYNLSAISISLAGLMHPLLAAILMPLSSIITLAIAWARMSRPSSL